MEHFITTTQFFIGIVTAYTGLAFWFFTVRATAIEAKKVSKENTARIKEIEINNQNQRDAFSEMRQAIAVINTKMDYITEKLVEIQKKIDNENME